MINTVTTQFSLRSVRLLSILLTVVWAFSPVGGQASLRVITAEIAQLEQQTIVQYMGMNGSYEAYMAADTGDLLSPVDALFLSSLAASSSIKNSSQGPRGNLKVPMLEWIPGYTRSGPNTNWIDVPGDGQIQPPYSSLLGIPIVNIPDHGNTTFTIETSYWTLNCPTLVGESLADTLAILKYSTSSAPSWEFLSWAPLSLTFTSIDTSMQASAGGWERRSLAL